MGNKYDIAECRDVLEQTIAYLWELENMRIAESWRKFPDGFY